MSELDVLLSEVQSAIRVMKRLKRFILTLLCMIAIPALFAFPTPAVDVPFNSSHVEIKQSPAGWHVITTEDKEFSILMPGQPVAFLKEDYYFSDDNIHVDAQRVISSLYGNTVFIVTLYETPNPKGLVHKYFETIKPAPESLLEVTVSGIQGREAIYNEDAFFHRVQCFATKHRAYVVEAAARDEHAPGINRFLSSMIIGGKAQPAKIGREEAESVDSSAENADAAMAAPSDAPPFNESEVTHKARLLYIPFPNRMGMARGTIKLQVALLSSGKVGEVKVLARVSSNELTQRAMEFARHVVFLPAEKDGRLVSQYAVLKYDYQ